MKLTYETGIATLIQFVTISVLNIATQITATVNACTTKGGQSCTTGSFTSILYYMLIVAWFGIIWALGYQTQQRRSRRLSVLLIAVEFGVFVIAYHNARAHKDMIGLITSLVDIGFAIWVSWLAFRLFRARGGRIVASERARRRKRPATDL